MRRATPLLGEVRIVFNTSLLPARRDVATGLPGGIDFDPPALTGLMDELAKWKHMHGSTAEDWQAARGSAFTRDHQRGSSGAAQDPFHARPRIP